MVSGISTALSGYHVAISRLDAAASNIANQASTQSTDQNGRTVNMLHPPLAGCPTEYGGPPGATQRATKPASSGSRQPTNDPTNRAANALRGSCRRLTFDPAQQLASANIAGYDAKANLKSIKLQDEMIKQTLNIIS